MSHIISENRESESSLGGWFRLGVPHEDAVKLLTRVQPSEALSGAWRTISSLFPHMARCRKPRPSLALCRRPWFLVTWAFLGLVWVPSWQGSWFPQEQVINSKWKPLCFWWPSSEIDKLFLKEVESHYFRVHATWALLQSVASAVAVQKQPHTKQKQIGMVCFNKTLYIKLAACEL